MNLEQMKARLAAILDLVKAMHAKNGDLTNEEITQANELNAEFEDLKVKVEAAEKLEAMNAAASAGRKVEPQAATLPRVSVAASQKEKNGGFNNTAEFLVAVKQAASGNIHKNFQNTMYERSGEEGGYLVPEEISTSIKKKLSEDESLLNKTSQMTISGNGMTLPIDESAPWTGGVQAYWTAEGAPITESKDKLGLASWKLNKLAALVKMTDELLDDAVGLESYITSKAPVAIMHAVNKAIISGTGVGKPSGLLNSGFRVKVLKESGQSTDTVVAKNIINMYSRMLPASRARAEWYINAAVEPQLRGLKDDNGNFIYLAPGSQMNQTPYGLLMGRPVVPLLGGMPALGDEGDIVFADLSYYQTILKSGGIKNALSTHLYFDRDITAYKFTFRIDGSCPFKSPVTTEFGAYQMSGIVTLEDR